VERVAVLTRDCAGVNAAIRSVVRSACSKDVEVLGVLKGFDGLIDCHFAPLGVRSVSGIINRGGTILKTSRSDRFFDEKCQEQAAMNLRENDVDGLICIGGNGTLTGAHVLGTKYKIPVVGVPATIDNDVTGVDLCVGADTAVNVALDALDKIRDTATSLERIFVLEVMGRSCGYLALSLALAGGCEEVLIPELDADFDRMCNEIIEGNKRGKVSWIVVVAEGKAKASDIATMISEKTGLETRVAVLGHIQRGGRPTATDRLMAARLGNYAVEVLLNGLTDHCVTIKDSELTTVPLGVAIEPKEIDTKGYYKLIKLLT